MGKVFNVVVELETVASGLMFDEAFKLFWETIIKKIDEGYPMQLMEANWILFKTPSGGELPLMFDIARDLAYDLGMLSMEEGEKKPTLHPLEDSDKKGDMIIDALGDAARTYVEQLMESGERVASFLENEAEKTPV